MSAPTTTTLIVVPRSSQVGLIAMQALPRSEGVRIVASTPGQSSHLRGMIFDTVIVMPECRSGAHDAVTSGRVEHFFALIRSLHRGNGPWIEMDPNFRNLVF